MFNVINNIYTARNLNWLNDLDDYPNDSNLHEKITIISDSVIVEQNGGLGGIFYIDSDCKFIVVNWEVTSPLYLTPDEQHNITLELIYPPNLNLSYYYNYDILDNRNLYFTIDISNYGNWNYGFLNIGLQSNVTIYREILILK